MTRRSRKGIPLRYVLPQKRDHAAFLEVVQSYIIANVCDEHARRRVLKAYAQLPYDEKLRDSAKRDRRRFTYTLSSFFIGFNDAHAHSAAEQLLSALDGFVILNPLWESDLCTLSYIAFNLPTEIQDEDVNTETLLKMPTESRKSWMRVWTVLDCIIQFNLQQDVCLQRVIAMADPEKNAEELKIEGWQLMSWTRRIRDEFIQVFGSHDAIVSTYQIISQVNGLSLRAIADGVTSAYLTETGRNMLGKLYLRHS